MIKAILYFPLRLLSFISLCTKSEFKLKTKQILMNEMTQTSGFSRRSENVKKKKNPKKLQIVVRYNSISERISPEDFSETRKVKLLFKKK